MQRFTFPQHDDLMYADRIRFYMDAMGARFDQHTNSYVANHGITELLDAVMTDAEFAELQAQVDGRRPVEVDDRLSDVACRFVAAMLAHDLTYHWDDDPQEILNDDYGFRVPARDIERIREWGKFFAYMSETLDCHHIVWCGPAVNDVPFSREGDLTGIEEWVIENSDPEGLLP